MGGLSVEPVPEESCSHRSRSFTSVDVNFTDLTILLKKSVNLISQDKKSIFLTQPIVFLSRTPIGFGVFLLFFF